MRRGYCDSGPLGVHVIAFRKVEFRCRDSGTYPRAATVPEVIRSSPLSIAETAAPATMSTTSPPSLDHPYPLPAGLAQMFDREALGDHGLAVVIGAGKQQAARA